LEKGSYATDIDRYIR